METREIRKAIFALAVPASLEAVFQMGLGFVDQIVIAQMGEAPLAAVGLTNSLMFVVTLVLGALSAGTAILVARNQGRQDGVGVSRSIGSAIQVSVLLTVPLALGAAVLPEQMLRLLGAAPDVAESGREFFRLIALTLPLSVTGSVMVGALRSLGDARTPMFITFMVVVCNTLLNLVLVFGLGPIPALGVVGAACATVTSQVLRLGFLSWRLLLNGRAFLQLRHWVEPDRLMLTTLLQLSLPIAMTQILWAVGNLSYTLLGVRLGTTAIVATQMVNATEGLFLMFSSGLSAAALTLVGQSLGAGALDDMKAKARQVMTLGLGSSILFGAVLASMSLWVHFFYPTVSQETLRLAILGIMLNALFQPAKVLNMILGNGLLPAGGDTRFILFVDVIAVYMVGLPLVWLLAFVLDMGLPGIFIGRLAEEVVKLAFLFFRYRTLRWFHVLATPEPALAPSL
ncbi:MATE family efflux transporter [Vitiosangium sp. GDMCC 1.1324]|uniref:MATE family efflux transporter n=1 Tax=Vitiosangium sp. (strain GDMCC 1.1324) TaxID=2138576 RepID=UPI000D38F0BA|nr:MATE family efflux transporter [Vitiosangium sp. GDMCC 1.1324]PTL84517.1 MATE family efflux transporter [Vitiosangium sp. GDMCC 1.1324]